MADNKISKFFTFIALILLFILALSLVFYPKSPNKSEPVIPAIIKNPKVFSDIKSRFVDIRRIKITVPDGAFQLVKNNENWFVVERDNYPASQEFLQIFQNDISNLEKGGLITSDPALFDKMGVGEPMEFGEGTIVELFDPQDQVISSSHVGKTNNEIYVRRMGDRNIFAAQGKFTDIGILNVWLDLNVFQINSNDINSIMISRNGAPNLDLIANNQGEFLIDGIRNIQINNLLINVIKPKLYDVTPRERIKNSKIADVKIILKDNRIIEYSLHQQFKAYWLILSPQELTYQGIKPFAKNWAYKIDDEIAKQILQSKSALKTFVKQ